MGWTFMRFGLPNGAAILALALLPIVALVVHSRAIVGQAQKLASEVEALSEADFNRHSPDG